MCSQKRPIRAAANAEGSREVTALHGDHFFSHNCGSMPDAGEAKKSFHIVMGLKSKAEVNKRLKKHLG